MTDDELKNLFDSLQQGTAELRKEMRQGFADLHQEIQQGDAETRKEMRQGFADLHQEIQQGDAETRRQFGAALEATDHKIQLVAESVLQGNEASARRDAELDAKIDRTAAETQAMFKFSHAELDRRMRTLETNFADLQARVERLESSTR